MTQVQNTLNATNFTAANLNVIRALFTQYIPGLTKTYGSIRYVSNARTQDQPQIPCAMIAPILDEAKMDHLALTGTFYNYRCVLLLSDDDPDNLITKLTDAGNIVMKLFSNNALGTINGQFRRNEPYWDDSTISPIEYISPIVLGRKNDKYYYGVADFRLRLQTLALK